MQSKGYSYHVSRSQMGELQFDDCSRCKNTVVRARVAQTQREQVFDPKPTGGSEVDPAYSLHVCPKTK